MATDTEILDSLSANPKYANLKPQIEGLRSQKHSDTDILNSLVASPKYSILKPQVEQFRGSKPTGDKPAGWKEKVAPFIEPVAEAVGTAAGAALALPTNIVAPGVGEALGATGGYLAGKEGARAIKQAMGVEQPTTIPQEAKETLKSVPEAAIQGASGPILGGTMQAGAKTAEIGGATLEKTAVAEKGLIGAGYDAVRRKLSPIGIMGTAYQKASDSAFAKEGKELSKETGIDLTPAQETGSKLLNLAENTARKYGQTADQIHVHDVTQANQAIEKVNTMLNKISPAGVGSEALGTEIRMTTENAIGTVKKVRDAAAKVDYGAVRMLAGDKPVIPVTNLRKELTDIATEYDIPGGERIASQASQMLKRLDGMVSTTSKGGEFTDRMTVDKAMTIRSIYSKASAGTGDIFTDIDKGQSRGLAVRLLKAVDKDFDVAPTAIQGVDEKVSEALKIANRNYKTYSQHINAIENTVLGKLLGKNVFDPFTGNTVNNIAPEKLAERMMKLYPSELREAKRIIIGNSPATWNAIRRYSLEQALEKGMDIAPSAGMNPVPMSTSKFISALPKRQNLEILFSPKEVKQIENLQKTLVRMGDRSTANFSNPSIVSDFLSWFSVKGAVKGATKLAGLKYIANAMTTPGGRWALMDIAKKESNPAALDAAVRTFMTMYGPRADKESAPEWQKDLISSPTEKSPETPIPQRAEGGPVESGQPVLVGEKGPEVIVPKQAGTVIPYEQLKKVPRSQLKPEDLQRLKEGQKQPNGTPQQKTKSSPDYDYAGYLKSGGKQLPEGQHYPDTFKLPSHITFSTESKYSKQGREGGQWKYLGKDSQPLEEKEQGGTWHFYPSKFNLQKHTAEEYKEYFKTKEPKSVLHLPGEEVAPKVTTQKVEAPPKEAPPKTNEAPKEELKPKQTSSRERKPGETLRQWAKRLYDMTGNHGELITDKSSSGIQSDYNKQIDRLIDTQKDIISGKYGRY